MNPLRWLRTLLCRPRRTARPCADPDLGRVRARQRDIAERVRILGLDVDIVRRRRRAASSD